MVADRIVEHCELGFRLVGFADDRAGTSDSIGYRGLPLLGTIADLASICAHEKVDEIYVALPIEEHVKMLGVVEYASRECINVHVVPDLLQFIALRARLDGLGGLPLISIDDVQLRGFASVLERVADIATWSAVDLVGVGPALIVDWHIHRSSRRPLLYTQVRMALDCHAFTVCM